jgi:hypothetical protein
MANTNPKKYVTAFHMRVDREFIDALDEVRNAERPILSRADYVRRLVFEALTKKQRRERAT